MSTLSVEISTSGSSMATVSPTALSQRVTVPSVTLSPRAGRTTGVEPMAELCADGTGIGVTAAGAAGSAAATATGSTTAGSAAGSAAGAATIGVEVATESALPISASWAPTATTLSSGALISRMIPAEGAVISVSTLSVDTSTIGSSMATVSPTFLSQRETVPSVTLSPSMGIVTETDIVTYSFVQLRGGS